MYHSLANGVRVLVVEETPSQISRASLSAAFHNYGDAPRAARRPAG